MASFALFQLKKEYSQAGEVSFPGGFKDRQPSSNEGEVNKGRREIFNHDITDPNACSGLHSLNYYSTVQGIKNFLKRLAPFHFLQNWQVGR